MKAMAKVCTTEPCAVHTLDRPKLFLRFQSSEIENWVFVVKSRNNRFRFGFAVGVGVQGHKHWIAIIDVLQHIYPVGQANKTCIAVA